MRWLQQMDHADLGLIDDDNTEDMRTALVLEHQSRRTPSTLQENEVSA